MYLAAVATILFFLAACFQCGAPRADPFCFNFGRANEPAKKKVEEKKAETVVLQPIIINEGSVADVPESPKKKSKKNKKNVNESV